MFTAWWLESYPTRPGPHALMTHLGWGRFLLEQMRSHPAGATTLAEAREEARQLAGPSAEVVHRYLNRRDLPA
jgi:hypothetical protein